MRLKLRHIPVRRKRNKGCRVGQRFMRRRYGEEDK